MCYNPRPQKLCSKWTSVVVAKISFACFLGISFRSCCSLFFLYFFLILRFVFFLPLIPANFYSIQFACCFSSQFLWFLVSLLLRSFVHSRALCNFLHVSIQFAELKWELRSTEDHSGYFYVASLWLIFFQAFCSCHVSLVLLWPTVSAVLLVVTFLATWPEKWIRWFMN